MLLGVRLVVRHAGSFSARQAIGTAKTLRARAGGNLGARSRRAGGAARARRLLGVRERVGADRADR
ncbi:hypothetical protein FM112_02215 [Gulosibacter sp. 10]|nr:hypothetical protein FM112_02215 [Gulosibacter sp. 10]